MLSAEERKKKRLEAWRKRRQQQQQQQQQQHGGERQEHTIATAPPPTRAGIAVAALPAPPAPPASVRAAQPKVSLSLVSNNGSNIKLIKKKKILISANDGKDFTAKDGKKKPHHPFGVEGDYDDDDATEIDASGRRKRPLPTDLMMSVTETEQQKLLDPLLPPPARKDSAANSSKRARTPSSSTGRSSRWDKRKPKQQEQQQRPEASSAAGSGVTASSQQQQQQPDALDQFMEKLQAGAAGTVTMNLGSGEGGGPPTLPMASGSRRDLGGAGNGTGAISIHVGGSMMRPYHPTTNPSGGTTVHPQQIPAAATTSTAPLYTPDDWLSDAAMTPQPESEEEEEARRALIEALKAAPAPHQQQEQQAEQPQQQQQGATAPKMEGMNQEEGEGILTAGVGTDRLPAQLASEVKSEKSRREERLRCLELAAAQAQRAQESSENPDTGRLYQDESGIVEEAVWDAAAAKAAPDALVVLAELNKKKELKAVDHSAIDYLDFEKNLYRVPRHLASLTNDQVVDRRAKLRVRVRGHGAPAPVSTFEECGVSEKVLRILLRQGIEKPFPVQAQCIPCIMAGRDVIGIAKTGSGKTLAYLLPMLRHILVQPALRPHVESGPIGLVLAPARELAYQIHTVCKGFTKQLGLKSTAVYGGAGVAEQIADLKRGTHVVVATPGRLIDILTMQSGKILSLQRVTFVVMDEADRMYDMGFAPQISAIHSAVRPDRQTVLFSATFPKAVEALARKSLKYPIEVIVGGRSVASDHVTQYAEVVQEHDKFLRLLQLLGEHVDGTAKSIVFVDTQVRADHLFEQLLRNGYPSLSLHGGKEQEDRDSTIADFKRKDGPNVLVATAVAGRGLDVPACSCVVNYSSPNHLEAYVHQVGRTGRASTKGVAYTLVNPAEEAKYAPIVVRALSEAGQSEHLSAELVQLSDEFKAKVAKGQAKYAGSGFKGKGYSYDASEMNESQKMARLEKRQALVEAGLLDPDDEDDEDLKMVVAAAANDKKKSQESSTAGTAEDSKKKKEAETMEIPANLTPELLALPGMKEALLRKAGIMPAGDKDDAGNNNGATSADDSSLGRPVRMGENHWLFEFEINDYPREARWKVTQKETTSRLQDEFRTAVTLKGSYFAAGKAPAPGERRLYLHLEATSERILMDCSREIQRLLNEETLRVGAKAVAGGGGGGSGGGGSHRYNVLG